ncbi:hypothetical protein [Nostoc sp. ChiQUE01b]|uniref:hypothetical protein n=1 Tax=Nostoc sp. ChiQUE01b TaxID=3075376 RepID=UPI002AD549EB|nr:hypothetical protein [Nostoc sp. ChiQUE01b]MDZ8260753.1 hypothetical protein [Nostoc sp. ChiQUE01b]
MNTYRMRGQLRAIQENELRTEIFTLRGRIKELETRIKSKQNPDVRNKLETELRVLQGQIRQAQADIIVAGFRIEAWDNDDRFDDRINSAKTDSAGIFEMQFTEADFLDLDWTPDLFFKVFQSRELLGTSEPRNDVTLPTDVNQPVFLEPFVILNEDESVSGYRIENVRLELLETEESQERPRQAFQESPITVYDILPTANQIVNTCSSSPSPIPADGRGCSLEQIINGALSEVLGRNLKDDPKAFVNSLNQTFMPKQIDGRTEYEWTPRAYVGVQNDLGGTVSGAQASLYHRAKAALNDALPLLNKIYPLNPAADQQNAEAMRGIIRTEMFELVNEMGTTGGPRIQRVDNLFQILLGSAEEDAPSEHIAGQLKTMADVFGLRPEHVNTVEEEQNYGNFLIIRDYLVALRGSWIDYVQDAEGGAFVGPQLILLSRGLSVVSESVQEVYRIMELVFLGPAERQAVIIDFLKVKPPIVLPADVAFPLPDGTGFLKRDLAKLVPPLSVEDLLNWAWRFGAEEGPALAKAGGKLGIAEAIAGTAERLMILVQAASFVPVANNGFRREGVLRALRDLALQLNQVRELAKQIIPPSTSYEPDALDRLPPSNSPTIPMRRTI